MKTLQIKDGDQTLNVEIEKMNAFAAEDWLIRAGMALGKSATEVDKIKDVRGLIGALCRVEYAEARPLLDKLLEGCYLVNGDFRRSVADSATRIQSPITMMKLRIESGKENFGFLADGSEFGSLMSSLGVQTAQKSGEPHDMKTSRRAVQK